MSKALTPKKPIPRRVYTRQDGAAIDLVAHPLVGTDGKTAIALSLDLSTAPVPDRRYTAGFCGMIHQDREIKLLFGQDKIGGSPSVIRNMIVIKMTELAAQQFLDSIHEIQSPTLAEIAITSNVTPVPLRNVDTEPAETVEMVSSVVAVAISGHEVCLDFYHVSAFSVLSAPTTKKLGLDPVVRVDLRTSYFLSLIASLENAAKNFTLPVMENENA